MSRKMEDSCRPPTIWELVQQAEEEFIKSYGSQPTYAVYAPGCLNISGDTTNFSEDKSVLMAIDLVTVIVGKGRRHSRWCHLKTLNKNVGKQEGSFYMSIKDLNVLDEEIPWIRYIKGTAQSFKVKRGGFVPGFKIVIASSVPTKRGLSSSAALVVAMYTFLEALTGQPTLNIFEKALSCSLVEKLILEPPNFRLADILSSIFGEQRRVFQFDARTLETQSFPWRDKQVHLLLIEPDSSDRALGYFERTISCRKTSAVVNVANRWGTKPIDFSVIEALFPKELVNAAKYVSEENARVQRTVEAIKKESWTRLGKVLWDSYCSALKYLDPVSTQIASIVEVLECTEGVLGVNVIGRGYGGSILALIQGESLEDIISILKSRRDVCKQYFILRPIKGASILYCYQNNRMLCASRSRYSKEIKEKYHLNYDKEFHDDRFSFLTLYTLL